METLRQELANISDNSIQLEPGNLEHGESLYQKVKQLIESDGIQKRLKREAAKGKRRCPLTRFYGQECNDFVTWYDKNRVEAIRYYYFSNLDNCCGVEISW